MRKFAGTLLAAVMVLPIGLIACGPAGSATAAALTCTKLTGTVTWTPAVPLAPKTAKSNILLKATLAGCTGTAKITSGVITLPVIKGTVAQNCTVILTKPTKITATGGSVVWATTKAKSTLGLLTLTPAGLATYKASAKVTKGQFLGKTLTLTGTFAAVPKTGCVSTPLSKANLTLKKGTTAIVK